MRLKIHQKRQNPGHGIFNVRQSAFGAHRFAVCKEDEVLCHAHVRFDHREKNYARAIKSFLLYRKVISYKVKQKTR